MKVTVKLRWREEEGGEEWKQKGRRRGGWKREEHQRRHSDVKERLRTKKNKSIVMRAIQMYWCTLFHLKPAWLQWWNGQSKCIVCSLGRRRSWHGLKDRYIAGQPTPIDPSDATEVVTQNAQRCDPRGRSSGKTHPDEDVVTLRGNKPGFTRTVVKLHIIGIRPLPYCSGENLHCMCCEGWECEMLIIICRYMFVPICSLTLTLYHPPPSLQMNSSPNYTYTQLTRHLLCMSPLQYIRMHFCLFLVTAINLVITPGAE